MPEGPQYGQHDHTLLVVFVAVFIFNSPLTSWWATLNWPWYAIFVPWTCIIALTAVNQWRQTTQRQHDDN